MPIMVRETTDVYYESVMSLKYDSVLAVVANPNLGHCMMLQGIVVTKGSMSEEQARAVEVFAAAAGFDATVKGTWRPKVCMANVTRLPNPLVIAWPACYLSFRS